jgi:hypothetical protein
MIGHFSFRKGEAEGKSEVRFLQLRVIWALRAQRNLVRLSSDH